MRTNLLITMAGLVLLGIAVMWLMSGCEHIPLKWIQEHFPGDGAGQAVDATTSDTTPPLVPEQPSAPVPQPDPAPEPPPVPEPDPVSVPGGPVPDYLRLDIRGNIIRSKWAGWNEVTGVVLYVDRIAMLQDFVFEHCEKVGPGRWRFQTPMTKSMYLGWRYCGRREARSLAPYVN